MTLPDLSRFAPESWDDIAGNDRIKEHFKDQIRALRFTGLANGTNTIIHGDIGTGKTSTVRFFARCLLCQVLDPATLNPMCMGRCATCSVDVARYGELGLTRYSLESDFNYMPINCMLIKDASELREQVRYMQDFNGIRIIYLDEISRLVNRGMDEVLLGPLEDLNYMWIASGSNLTGLDPAFLDRFPAKIKTKLPTIEILPTWLVRRCVASNIDFDPEAIILLAERSNYACRKALKPLVVLNAKLSSQRILTVKFVEEFEF